MTMQLAGMNLDLVRALSVTGEFTVSVPYTIVHAQRIDFVAPGGAPAFVSLVAAGVDGGVVLTEAYELVQPMATAFSVTAGALITLAENVQLVVTPGAFDAALPLTCTAVDPIVAPPGGAPLESFVLEAGGDAIGGQGSSLTTTLAIHVPPALAAFGATPQLFVFDAVAGIWIPAVLQSYDAHTGMLHAVVSAPARFVVSVVGSRRWWLPAFGRPSAYTSLHHGTAHRSLP
jgi:hypothetical protein